MKRFAAGTAILVIVVAAGVLLGSRGGAYHPDLAEFAMKKPMSEKPDKLEKATFGGGCFWCVEAVYQRIEGVWEVISGYAGGHLPDPTYADVTAGSSGHAEVVQVHFDPQRIAYADLLEIFWGAHDPTTLNRQGADVGSHYRSIILYHDEAQRDTAEQSKAASAVHFRDPIVTEVVPLQQFYPAESYHQNYYQNNPNAGYCTFVIRPKLNKLGLE